MLRVAQRRALTAVDGAAKRGVPPLCPALLPYFRWLSTGPPSAAGAEVVSRLALSPSQPLPHIFREVPDAGDTAHSRGQPLVHTGYAGDGGIPFSAPSFAVIAEKDFEAIVAEALASFPAEGLTAAEGAGDGAFHNHLTRELQRLVRNVDAELAPMLAVKDSVDRYAYKRFYPLLKIGCFAVLAAQFALYFNWVFFVFDWNLVEPTTYFIAYTGVFSSLVYHYLHCNAAATATSSEEEDYNWRNLFRYLAERKARSLYEKEGLDIGRLTDLEATKRLALAELAKYKP